VRAKAWPFVDRPALRDAFFGALMNEGHSIWWIVGGEGTGKTSSLLRTMETLRKKDKDGTISYVIDFVEIKHRGSVGSDIDAFVRDSLIYQLTRNVALTSLVRSVQDIVPNFKVVFENYAKSKPLLSNLLNSSKNFEEVLKRVFTSPSVVHEVLLSISLGSTKEEELINLMRLCKASTRRCSIALLHAECLDLRNLNDNSTIRFMMRPELGINVLVECNDSLRTIWNICDTQTDAKIIQVGDLPKEAVKAIFVPSLLSDDVHVEALYRIIGGRVGSLQRLLSPLNLLNEEQRVADEEQEQRYRSGKENRPSAESKELQVSPLVYRREVALRESLVSGILKEDVDLFESKMNSLMNESNVLVPLKQCLSPVELNVLLNETIRLLVGQLERSGSLPLPSDLSPLDLAHPVILALLESNILMIEWLPFPRLVTESQLKLFLLGTWQSSQLEAMTAFDRAQFNLCRMNNRVHLEKQLEKLGR
jgi:hypothetical protein